MDPDEDLRIRIEMARTAFVKMKAALTNKHLNLHTRLRFAKSYVWTVLLHGCETWTLKTKMISRIEAFEMWVYRRMLKIPWTKKISNEAVLGMMGRGRELVSVIKRRKMEYLGHMIRGP
ncbi:uncharacterized protein LOC143922722 isoform X1 [Arctopsyche grandis]|uniref:uncharacterized protein LOC143922722 isoform X1 n=1 Tax=Arctopsyche grandis TaxID=121162 RepID=UPI00406D955B